MTVYFLGKPPAALINRWERNTINKILSVFRVWCLNLQHFGGKLGLTWQDYHCSSIKLMAPLPRIGQWANWGSIPFWSVFNEKQNIYIMQAFLHWHPRQNRQKNTFLDSWVTIHYFSSWVILHRRNSITCKAPTCTQWGQRNRQAMSQIIYDS